MFPLQISPSYFLEPEMSSSHSSSAEIVSTYSDSDSTMSTTSSASDSISFASTVSCFYDASTCQYQHFSIPEKILYYIAKNVTNAKTYQKLVETCKYFFKVNPVIVVPQVTCFEDIWCTYYDINWKHRVGIKYDQLINGKIWVTECLRSIHGEPAQLIPLIYKNDANVVELRGEPFKFEEFLFLASNAVKLLMFEQLVKYENGKTVQLEDIVKNLPKLQILDFISNDGSDLNCNTTRKLMEIEHFKNISKLGLYNVTEGLDVEGMYNYINENRNVYVELRYRREISDVCKELVREYSNRLKNEEGCNSRIGFYEIDTIDDFPTSSSEDDGSDIFFNDFDDNNISDIDENEGLLFPWKNEENEEWEFPWDKSD